VEVETGEEFWISGPRRDGADRLYVRDEYWVEIRRQPSRVNERIANR
jgi:hypothetical protein